MIPDWTEPDAGAAFDTAQEMAVNFAGPAELTRLLLPDLAREQSAQVVLVTSGLALAPKRSSPVYCASKAALRSFAKSLRAQVHLDGVAKGRAEIDVGATALLRLILRLSPALGERIMIGR